MRAKYCFCVPPPKNKFEFGDRRGDTSKEWIVCISGVGIGAGEKWPGADQDQTEQDQTRPIFTGRKEKSEVEWNDNFPFFLFFPLSFSFSLHFYHIISVCIALSEWMLNGQTNGFRVFVWFPGSFFPCGECIYIYISTWKSEWLSFTFSSIPSLLFSLPHNYDSSVVLVEEVVILHNK